MKTVGIIGGSGFIGSHVTKKFLKENYRVKVSSTNMDDKSKYAHLSELENAANLEICPLDLRQPATIAGFVEGCQMIIHSGTPFQLDVKDPQTELFEPTVNGTNHFLSVIKNMPGIEKVVFIASVAAWNTSYPLNPATYESDHIFSEKDTPYYSENDHPYAQAKFIADQAIRSFVNEHRTLGFEIVTVSPVFVIGKALSGRGDSTSQSMQYLIKNKIAPNPFVEMLFANNAPFSLVDVRDVAEAVYQAATISGLHGNNYLIANETYSTSDISLMLNHQPPVANAAYTYDNALAKMELGIAFTSAKETFSELA
jgi:dihydroflavonol-4-reductase